MEVVFTFEPDPRRNSELHAATAIGANPGGTGSEMERPDSAVKERPRRAACQVNLGTRRELKYVES